MMLVTPFLLASACFHTATAVKVEDLLNQFFQNLTAEQVEILKKPAIQGTPCVRDGINGICLKMHRCPCVIVDLVQSQDHSLCGSEGGVPLVCCTDCEDDLVRNIRSAVFNERVGLMWKSDSMARNAYIDYVEELSAYQETVKFGLSKLWDESMKCHRAVALPISGGVDAYSGEFPFMALLGYEDSQTGIKWQCGGTLISHRFVLTAGHCICDENGIYVSHVALGLTYRSQAESPLMQYSVQEIIKHPEYDSPSLYNDIALLKTTKPIIYTDNIGIACLACLSLYEPDDSGSEEWDHAKAMGWGYMGRRGKPAEVLQVVELDWINYEICNKVYRPYRNLKYGINRTTQICYGDYNRQKDTCKGDSGGPLVVFGEVSSYPPSVIAVISSGGNCPLRAAIYTKVKPYLLWIEDIVWPDNAASSSGHYNAFTGVMFAAGAMQLICNY